MQAAGERVVLVGEFSARVQPGQDDLDPRQAFHRMQVDRHAAAVVGDADPAIGLQRDRNLFCVTG